MMKLAIAALLLAAATLASCADAATITWVGLGSDNLYTTAANWSPARVPGPNDDAVLNNGTIVLAQSSVTILSFTMADAKSVVNCASSSCTINGAFNFKAGTLTGSFVAVGLGAERPASWC